MKKYKTPIIALGIVGLLFGSYWLICFNFNVKVVVINKSEIVCDSIQITVFPDKSKTFYNVQPHDTLTEVFKIRNSDPHKRRYFSAGATV